MISIIGILLTIFFVIGTHETAHFIVARLLGVKVLRFSIGFGKALYRWHDKSGTEYVLALLPLGGYVKMLDENEEPVPNEQLPFAYNRQPFYKKFLIVLAGPLTNIFCAFILYWLIFMIGFITIKPIIDSITPNSLAAQAGLSANQEIIRIDNQPTTTWMGIMFRLLAHAGDQDHVLITVKNKQVEQTHAVDLFTWRMNKLTPDPLSSIGIIPGAPKTAIHKIKYSPIAALTPAWREINDFTYYNLVILSKLITGKLSLQSLGGPITIFESAGDAFYYGLLPFLSFLAFLSISIGIINLLPIPGLDGGHLFIQIIEFIIRRPLPEAILATLYKLGILLLVFVLVQAMINDVLRLL